MDAWPTTTFSPSKTFDISSLTIISTVRVGKKRKEAFLHALLLTTCSSYMLTEKVFFVVVVLSFWSWKALWLVCFTNFKLSAVLTPDNFIIPCSIVFLFSHIHAAALHRSESGDHYQFSRALQKFSLKIWVRKIQISKLFHLMHHRLSSHASSSFSINNNNRCKRIICID